MRLYKATPTGWRTISKAPTETTHDCIMVCYFYGIITASRTLKILWFDCRKLSIALESSETSVRKIPGKRSQVPEENHCCLQDPARHGRYEENSRPCSPPKKDLFVSFFGFAIYHREFIPNCGTSIHLII